MRTSKFVEASKTVLVAMVVGVLCSALPALSQGGAKKGFGSFGQFKGFGQRGGGGAIRRLPSYILPKLGSSDIRELPEVDDGDGISTTGSRQYSEIRGQVLGENGQPAQGIEVLIKRLDGIGTYHSKSGKDGKYSYTGLSAGEYLASVVYKGDVGLLSPIDLAHGRTVECNFDLRKFEAVLKRNKFDGILDGRGDQDSFVNPELKIPNIYKEQYEKALALAAKGQYAEAKAILKDLVERKGEIVSFHYRLGEVEGYLQEYREAAMEFRKAMELDPKEAGYPMLVSYSLLLLGELDEAGALAEKAAKLNVEVGGVAYYNLGIALTDQGNLPKAEAAFRRATELDGGFSDAFYELGLTLLSTHEDDLKMARGPLETFLGLEAVRPTPANAPAEEVKRRAERMEAAKKILAETR